MDGEMMYQRFLNLIENVNSIISPYESKDVEESWLIDPVNGSVAFGSGLFGFGISLTQFSRIYSTKFKVDERLMRNKLWGDNYFDLKQKNWKTDGKGEDDQTLPRSFVQFIVEPIIRLCRCCIQGENDTVNKMVKRLDIDLNRDEESLNGKDKLKLIMKKWINISDCILDMMILRLPSPVKA